MSIKSKLLTFVILVISNSASATIIDNGMFTTDTSTSLDWLDLNETTNRSYNNVSSNLGVGGDFEGWRYATNMELLVLFSNAGGTEPYNGYDPSHANFVPQLLGLWGVTRTVPGSYYSSKVIFDQVSVAGDHDYLHLRVNDNGNIYAKNHSLSISDTQSDIYYGSALVRVSSVPVPAAIWLFGSGLIGLIGVARSKTTQNI